MKAENDILKSILDQLQNDDAHSPALSTLLGSESGFDPGFADRVTATAFAPAEEKDISFYVPKMFRWVALSGVAAALVLLLMTWSDTQSIDADAISGISSLSLSDLFAENLY